MSVTVERSLSMEYKIGDYISHPGHGICQVDRTEERTLYDKTLDYYVIHPVMENHITIYVPIDNTKAIGLRPIVSSEEAKEVITYTTETDIPPIVQNKDRVKAYHDLMKSGNLKEMSALCKLMMVKENTGKISHTEKDMLKKLQVRVISEISLALDMNYDALLAHFVDNIKE